LQALLVVREHFAGSRPGKGLPRDTLAKLSELLVFD